MQDAAEDGARLVVLPEMFNCPYSNDSFPIYAEDVDSGSSESAAALSSAARESSVTLVAGSIPETSDGRLYNTCLVFDSGGKLLAKHRKASCGCLELALMSNLWTNSCILHPLTSASADLQIHLFDIDIPGKQTFKESDTLSPGGTITVVDTELGRIGIGICYDIRFPELAMLYSKRGVQLIVYPGVAALVSVCPAAPYA